MDAAEIIDRVGAGVLAALDTSERFLGVEAFAYRNADIKPEYITTVKVAEQLTAPERVVTLEASMKGLRGRAAGVGRWNNLNSKSAWSAITAAIRQANYAFGKERVDIRVDEASGDRPPLLIVEAKLGVQNTKGVEKDIDRLVNLFDLYENTGALTKHVMYGAVVFHAMQEQGTKDTLPAFSQKMFEHIEAHLRVLRLARPHLNFRANPLSATLRIGDICGDIEVHPDGTVERTFEKHGYAFQAGLVLIGNALDVLTVKF